MGKVKKDSSASQNNYSTLYTRSLLLRGVAGIYLCAFLTFYYQSPGLFGRNGILPAQSLYDTERAYNTDKAPVPLHNYLGLDVHYMLDLLSILGAVLSFLAFTSRKLCVTPIFMLLWLMYYYLTTHMQIFENQSDKLLLEAGVACIILAALTNRGKSGSTERDADVALVLVKWILMRFMFDSGSVKLFSGCPLWWTFQGIKHHFETLPLPTLLAWVSHHAPTDFLTATNIYTNFTELVCPWLFFLPNRFIRIGLFHWVFYLQLTIIFTGNYGFINFLISILLLALLDDTYLKRRSLIRLLAEVIISSVILTAAIYAGSVILHERQVTFQYEYLKVIRSMARLAPLVAVFAIVSAFWTKLSTRTTSSKGIFARISNISGFAICTLITLYLIGISTVPHFSIDGSLNITNTQLGKYYKSINKYYIVNEYGRHLRRMRTERFEVILEYSDHIEGPWKALPFAYKPWHENASLPFSGPYLPRLDMKFYDAAPTNYRDHLWMMALAYRILQNQPEVIRLLGVNEPFGTLPQYVRGRLYRFVYTPLKAQPKTFWRKTLVGEHFPPVSLTDPMLTTHLKNLNYPKKVNVTIVTNQILQNALDFLRKQLENFQAAKAILAISVTGVVINLISVGN